VYLKIFHALFTGRPSDTAGLLRACVSAFPDDAQTLKRLVSETLIGQTFPDAPPPRQQGAWPPAVQPTLLEFDVDATRRGGRSSGNGRSAGGKRKPSRNP
jgi:hypothetical protein